MTTESKRVRRSPWRRFAVVVVASVLAFAVAEVTYRTWRRANDWPYDAEEMRTAFVQAQNSATQTVPLPADVKDPSEREGRRWVLDPYVGFDTEAADQNLDGELTATDQSGGHEFKVVILGGSVAGVFAALGADTFTSIVGADERFQGRHVHVSNHARGGFKQPQQANELVFLLALGFRPSAVINIDGFNEVALASDNTLNGVHPLYPSHTHWLHLIGTGALDPVATELAEETRDAQRRVVRLSKWALDFELWRSGVAGAFLHRRVRHSMRDRADAQIAYGKRLVKLAISQGSGGPPIHGGRDQAISVAVEGWAQSSLCIQAICAARNIPYLHVLQPTLHDEGAKPATAEELANGLAPPGWIEGVHAGYPMLRARGERLRGEGVAFVDASRIFSEASETLYYDVCHFGKAGNETLARLVAKAFLDSLPPTQR
jgi:hypothetical protein